MDFTILKYTQTGTNDVGQPIYCHEKSIVFTGWLDMLSGDERDPKAIPTSSSHVIITPDTTISITNADRIMGNGTIYEITFVDNPVNIDHHLEIYLKVVA
ncbi:phage head-tail adapter protein [Streptococcus ictaluri]